VFKAEYGLEVFPMLEARSILRHVVEYSAAQRTRIARKIVQQVDLARFTDQSTNK
jgi:hypothetical protein